jgi:hypothetical protein
MLLAIVSRIVLFVEMSQGNGTIDDLFARTRLPTHLFHCNFSLSLVALRFDLYNILQQRTTALGYLICCISASISNLMHWVQNLLFLLLLTLTQLLPF